MLAEGADLKNPHRFKDEIPKTIKEEPIRPDHLDGQASEEWERLEKLMRAAGLWSATYQVSIELYVESYSNYRTALKAIRRYGHAIKAGTSSDGTVIWKRNPVSVELHKYKEETLKLLIELGLTPSARSRVSISSQEIEDDDPFLKVLA